MEGAGGGWVSGFEELMASIGDIAVTSNWGQWHQRMWCWQMAVVMECGATVAVWQQKGLRSRSICCRAT